MEKDTFQNIAFGMGIQIVLGLVWLILNFPASWECPESRELFKAAESWQLDEYTGVLYPLLLRIFGWLTGNRKMLLKGILSILQLGAAFLAYKCFLKQIFGEKKKYKAVFGTCFLITVPLYYSGTFPFFPIPLHPRYWCFYLETAVRQFAAKRAET